MTDHRWRAYWCGVADVGGAMLFAFGITSGTAWQIGIGIVLLFGSLRFWPRQ